MSSKPKSHKGMGDGEWMARLKSFASTGVWPSGEGNRPAPRQKKWHDLYQKILKCPMQARGQTTLFGGNSSCSCGFHTNQLPSTFTPVPQSLATDPGHTFMRPPPSLSKFTKSRFGGSHLDSLRPNLSPRKIPSPSSTLLPTNNSSVPAPSCSVSSLAPSGSVASPAPSGSVSSPAPSGSVASPAPSCSVSSPATCGSVSSPATSTSAPGLSSSAPFPASSSVRIIPNPVPSPFSIMPARTPSSVRAKPIPTADANMTVDNGEGLPAPAPVPAASFWLPFEMAKTIPTQDQRWIANALFQSGKLRPDVKMWYEPPVPALIYHQPPMPDRFFTHRLLVWMPYHLWKVRVFCPACGKQLTGYGVHKKARKVLDIDRYYLMITETLRCTACSLNYISSSQTVRDQLDLPHQKLFRLIITRRYACDTRVIRLLRDRTLGNSPTRLVKQLKENHGEEWMNRIAHYLGECADFVDRPSLFPVICQEPPEPVAIPTSRWILSVYAKDILSRLGHIKACITSTYGSVLKLDSTKKITKKLAGHGKGTGLWMSSVGNELGQILISVLSVQEGPGLDRIVTGLVERYRQAAIPPPVLLYVDCGCCVNEGESKLQSRFSQWPDLHIRLDIWHFMRRLAVGCTTDAHPLYPNFMASLSGSIFEWDAADLSLLRMAKKEQLRQEGVPAITDDLVNSRISTKELKTYCRRRTRGEETTINLIEKLLSELGGPRGRDLMGVPLLDQVRMEHIWEVQKRHIKCIQDVPGVQLYTAVGPTTVAGVILTRYRCARGSTSLESFHLHLNRFIPGTSANALHFQLYLLEGLKRWNQDRETAAVASQASSLLTYTGDVAQSININSMKVFGRSLVPAYRPPAQYTGELLGVDYLLSQTGQPLKIIPDSEQTEDMLEDVDEHIDQEDDEGFEDLAVDSVESLFDDSMAVIVTPSSTGPSSFSAAGPISSSSAAGSISALVTSAAGPISSSSAAGSISALVTSAAGPISSSSAPVPSTSESCSSLVVTISAQSAVNSSAVDESGVPGLDKVDSLAECLVELRDQSSLTLSAQQVSNIVALWQNLMDYDKQRIVFAARHQSKLTTGRFKSPKKRQEFTPGVDSLKRHALTTTAPLAQWPDCCRLMELIFIRLCAIHRSPRKRGNSSVSRWDLILTDYRRIRQLILANGEAMQLTNLQLVDVSHTTLVQWHNKRVKRQDTAVLIQGLDLPSRLSVATDPLSSAKVKPSSLPPLPGQPHQYHLPDRTVGQAKLKRKTPQLQQPHPQQPSLSHQQPQQPSLAHQQLQQPSLAHQQPQQPSLSHQQPQEPSLSHQQPQQPSLAHQQLQQPSLAHQQPQQPSLAHQQLQQPSLAHQQPQQPSLSHQKPQEPSLSHQQPQQPSLAHQQLQQPSLSHQQPQQPSLSHQQPQEPSLSHQQPQQPSLAHQQPQEPSLSHQQPQQPSLSHQQQQQTSLSHHQPSLSHQQLQQPSLSHQHPQQPSLSHQQPQQLSLAHQQLQQTSLSHQQPQQLSLAHQQLQQTSLSHQQPQQLSLSHQQPQQLSLAHQQLQQTSLSHQQLQQPSLSHQHPPKLLHQTKMLRPLLTMPQTVPQIVPLIAPQFVPHLETAVVPPAPVKRKIVRKVLHNTCKKCGKLRTKETGHSQYKGIIYCPSVETSSKEEWLEEIKKKAFQKH